MWVGRGGKDQKERAMAAQLVVQVAERVCLVTFGWPWQDTSMRGQMARPSVLIRTTQKSDQHVSFKRHKSPLK